MSGREILRRDRERKKTKQNDRAERRVRRVLRLPEVEQRVGKKHASIYEAIAKGLFPAPVPLGPRAVGWLEDEIDLWLEACIAERDNGGGTERSLPLAGQRRKGTLVPSSKKSSPLTGKSNNLEDLSDISDRRVRRGA